MGVSSAKRLRYNSSDGPREAAYLMLNNKNRKVI
jgi:hypothetical protein